MNEPENLTRRVARIWFATWPVGILGALLTWAIIPRFVRYTRSEESLFFELFAAYVVFAGAAILRAHWKELQVGGLAHLPTVLLFLVISLHAAMLAEYRFRSGDYEVYENAAGAVLAGQDPYAATDGRYRYPPLLAQVLAAGSYAGRAVGLTEERSWTAVFLVYETAQLALVGTSFLLLHSLGVRLGLTAGVASGLVTVFLTIGAPVIRTIHYNQPNLWLLNLVIVAMFTVSRRPSAAGGAVAVAAHLKLYPLILLLPWLAAGHVRTTLWTGIWAAAVLVPQFWFTPTLWGDFVEFAASFPPGTAFREGGFYSIGFNIAGLLGARLSPDARAAAGMAAWLAAVIAALAWLAHRVFRRRERETRPFFRTAGDTSDALAIALLISPLVWEHHFVLALPLAVFAAAVAPGRDYVRVASALTLVFLLPVFELFPLSYCRTFGLIWLLALTNPARVAGRGSDGNKKSPLLVEAAGLRK